MKGGLLEMVTAAVFRGGPLDGQRLDVEPSLNEYVCCTWGNRSMNATGQVAAMEHRYRRSLDRLKDGAAEFLYAGVRDTA